jgi:hypothetical protein
LYKSFGRVQPLLLFPEFWYILACVTGFLPLVMDYFLLRLFLTLTTCMIPLGVVQSLAAASDVSACRSYIAGPNRVNGFLIAGRFSIVLHPNVSNAAHQLKFFTPLVIRSIAPSSERKTDDPQTHCYTIHIQAHRKQCRSLATASLCAETGRRPMVPVRFQSIIIETLLGQHYLLQYRT